MAILWEGKFTKGAPKVHSIVFKHTLETGQEFTIYIPRSTNAVSNEKVKVTISTVEEGK